MSVDQQLPLEGFFVPAQLDTREKLLALRDDPNAGFLPFTDAEKTMGSEMLDYLGNKAAYPAGLGNRLQEIFLRQKGVGGIDMAKRALISVAFEYGDFALNAQAQLAALRDLQDEFKDDHFNPGVTLAEDFPEGHPGIAPLVRFNDILMLRQEGVQVTTFNPLKGIERRTVKANSTDTLQHKVIEDRYTTPETPEEVAYRIDSFSESTRIATVRPLVDAAVANEQARFDFWTARLRDTRRHSSAWIIGRQLLERVEANMQ
jgi:hypothetical protein